MAERCPIERQAAEQPQALAMVGESFSLTYRELNQCVAAVAQQLQQQIPAGGRFGALVRYQWQGVIFAFAALRANVIFCPINPNFPSAQQQLLRSHLGLSAIWGSDFAPLDIEFKRQVEPQGAVWLDPAQHANIILTSGSSGLPKAVLHRLENHLASANGAAPLMNLTPESGWLLSLPLFHVGGLAIPYRIFSAGARLILDNPQRSLRQRLESEPISHLSLVPTQLWRLLQSGWQPKQSQLQTLLLGGAPIPKPLIAQLEPLGLTPLVSYGLSEMASQVCTRRADLSASVGKPLAGREVKIDDGEICVRGATLFAGYWREGELDRALDSEGWFHTRDRGSWDERGELLVEGRIDNLFISGGENIQPERIEQRLVDHPNIAQAIVVPIQSLEWGARPVAFIEWLNPETSLSSAELKDWISAELPPFMSPDHYLPWPDQGGALKPSRKLLAQQAQQVLGASNS